MRLFLDTANIEQIRPAAKLGVICGVTTNPSLVGQGRAEVNYHEHRPGDRLHRRRPHFRRVPLSRDVAGTGGGGAGASPPGTPTLWSRYRSTRSGLEATSRLAKEGVKVNITLVFSVNQALLAAHAGATYVSPFVGRLDDVGHRRHGLSWRMPWRSSHRYHLPTQVIAASLRHPRHVILAAQAGAHIATIPYAVLMGDAPPSAYRHRHLALPGRRSQRSMETDACLNLSP